MKTRHIVMALCVCVALAFSACEKENNNGANNGGGNNPGGETHSGAIGKQLKSLSEVNYRKVYQDNQLYYTSGSGYTQTFVYSGGNFTTMTGLYYYSNGETEDEGMDGTILYDNNGRIIGYTAKNGQTINIDITYDNNGHITSIYIPEPDGEDWRRMELTWTNGAITSVSQEDNHTVTPSVTTYEWANGNLIRETYTDNEYTTTITYTYDNHPSYYSGMNEDILLLMEGPEALCKNNVTSRTRTEVNNNSGEEYSNTRNYTYTYNANGYPTSYKITREDDPSDYYEENGDITYIQYGDGSGADMPTMYYIGIDNANGFENIYTQGKGWYTNGATVALYCNNYYYYGDSYYTNYRFDHWQDGNTDNPRIVTCTGNATYTATYVENNDR